MDPLLESLTRELAQEETSASVHTRKEAARLRDTPLASALLAVAEHAEERLAALPDAMRQPTNVLGEAAGRAFSFVRDLIVDRTLTRERSYRGTLLGMRHGLDLVKALRDVAVATGEQTIANWCEAWLATREPLVERAAELSAWFAAHRETAMESALA